MNTALPIVFLVVFVFALLKKVNAYNSFIEGAKDAIPLAVSLFPYVACMVMGVELMRASGLYNVFEVIFAPILNLFGIPRELAQLVLLRPFSGSGSLALVNSIFDIHGVDSYIGRSASVIYGSTETIFYLTTVYFSGTSIKRLGIALPIALFCCLLSAIIGCFLCRIM